MPRFSAGRVLVWLALAMLVAGCGQKGPLYLTKSPPPSSEASSPPPTTEPAPAKPSSQSPTTEPAPTTTP